MTTPSTSPQIRKACTEAVAIETAREWLDDLDPMFEGDDKTTLASALLRLHSEAEAMRGELEIARHYYAAYKERHPFATPWPCPKCSAQADDDCYYVSGAAMAGDHGPEIHVERVRPHAALAAEGGSGDE